MRRAAVLLAATIAVAIGCQQRAGARSDAAAEEPAPKSYALGHPATPAEIAAQDIDVNASGAGLPAGHGDATHGEQLYRAQCAICHGAVGEGIPPNPALIGRDPREGFPFASDFKLRKTIGNYWPYATTLYDYIRRAMPLPAPGTLSSDDVYSLTAYLLAANEVIPAGSSLDSASLVAVKMPARDKFVRDDRKGGSEVK